MKSFIISESKSFIIKFSCFKSALFKNYCSKLSSPVALSTHPYIYLISGGNLCKTSSEVRYAMPPKRICSWCVNLRLMRQLAVNASSYAYKYVARAPTNGVQQLIHSAFSVFPSRKKSVAVMLKTKLKRTIFRQFPGYWWSFWMQHLSRFGARLFEERSADFRL